MTTIWLLDVDGVINADDPGHVWEEAPWKEWAYSGANRYRIRWAPSLTARIRQIANSGKVEIRWSTTWVDDVDQLERMFRLPTLKKAFSGLTSLYVADLKLQSAQAVLAQGHRLIWTDDQEVPKPEWFLHEELTSAGDCLLIRPNDRYGLTPEHLDAIEAFIDKGNEVVLP